MIKAGTKKNRNEKELHIGQSMKNEKTKKSFADKWNNNKSLFLDNVLDETTDIHRWIMTRNGWGNQDGLKIFLKSYKRILDAGCGNGRVTKLLRNNSDLSSEIVGIDLVAHQVAKENLRNEKNVNFYQKDLTQDLKDLGKFDFIYSQEVLHHTSDPAKSFDNLVEILDDHGTIAIYVYKKKAPVREFVDDHIRNIMLDMGYEEAMEEARKLTDLGKILSELNINISVTNIDSLGIKEGEYDLQRFMYHHFLKCFWNKELSYEENIVINYDWYHPQLCTRHTLSEVEQWFIKNNLQILHICEDFYGITLHGKKL